MKTLLRFLTAEAILIVLQIVISLFFIKFFISEFTLTSYGRVVFAISLLATFSMFDLPLELRISAKLSEKRRYFAMKYILMLKFVVTIFVAILLQLVFKLNSVLMLYSFTFTISQYLINSSQTVMNVLQKSYSASFMHLIIPIINFSSIALTSQLDKPLTFFLVVSSIAYLSIIFLIIGYLNRYNLINLKFPARKRTLARYYYVYLLLNLRMVFVRFKFIGNQNIPIILISANLGAESTGLYALVMRLLNLANAITSKFTFLVLPKLLKTNYAELASKTKELIKIFENLALLCCIIVLPLSLFFMKPLIKFFDSTLELAPLFIISLSALITIVSIKSLLGSFFLTSQKFKSIAVTMILLDVLYYSFIFVAPLASSNPIILLLLVLNFLSLFELIFVYTRVREREFRCS